MTDEARNDADIGTGAEPLHLQLEAAWEGIPDEVHQSVMTKGSSAQMDWLRETVRKIARLE